MSCHNAVFESYIELINGEITYCVNASPRTCNNYKLFYPCVYRESISGNKITRNLYIGMYGYIVNFDFLEEWSEFYPKTHGPYTNNYLNRIEENLIFEKYPKFKYVYDCIKKKCFDLKFIFSILQFWIKHPECEYVFKAGFDKIALDSRFYKLSKKKQAETFATMKRLKGLTSFCEKINFNQLMFLVNNPKTNLSIFVNYISELNSYYFEKQTMKFATYENYCYYNNFKEEFTSFRQFAYYYRDYIVMCEALNKNLSDKFWKFPKNFRVAHNKILKEHQEYKKTLEIKELERRKAEYKKICSKFFPYGEKIGGYDIYVPQYDEWEDQAKVLNQCILYADYQKKVIEKQSLLIFVRKENIPVATCEVNPVFEIKQFYANELDRHNCLPTEDVKAAMNIWIDKISKKFHKIG